MKFKPLMIAAAFLCTSAYAEVSITTGAGYMPMSKELAKAYQQATGQKAVENYGGNIGQMLAQVAAGNGVNIVISDLGTLKRIKSPVQFSKLQKLGNTPLVFIWKKGSAITGPQDLTTDKVKTFTYPDPKAAIYGRAAKEYLDGLNVPSLKDKTMQIASVPQVMAYVSKGEVDAGFLNRTAARQGKDKIGGSVEITQGYAPIEIVAAVVKGQENDKDVQAFLNFLNSEGAKKLLVKHGIDK